MRLASLFLSSFLAVLASAATLAPNLPDGVYQSYEDDAGLEVHMQLSNSVNDRDLPLLSWTHDPSTATSNSSTSPLAQHPFDSLEKRNDCSPIDSNEQVFCGCSFPVNHANCDAAVADLKNQVGPHGVQFTKQMSYYSIRNNVVAFICCFHPTGWSEVTVDLITKAAASITDRCGWYIAGTHIVALGGSADVFGYDIGYMQYTSGLDFCAHARNSGQNCC